MKIKQVLSEDKWFKNELPKLCNKHNLYVSFASYYGEGCFVVRKKDLDKVFINGDESQGNYFSKSNAYDNCYCFEEVEEIKDFFEVLEFMDP